MWVAAVLFALFALQVTVLAFPQLIIPHSVQAGTVVIYYDGTPGTDVYKLANEVGKRLQGSGFYDSSRTDRVFLCQSQRLYTLFTLLAMVPKQAQGFGLSIFDNTFVSELRVTGLTERSGGFPKYGIWEGSLAHTITHEIGHLYMTDRTGRSRWKSLPHWKQEGFPEYVANIAPIHEDSLATLPHRFGILNTERVWGYTQRWDRIHYEAGLLVEFLFDIQGHTLDDFVADSVTREETLDAMMAWIDAQQNKP